MDKFDRYLKICAWAVRRYSAGKFLVTHVGGQPTKYTRIVDAAANKILGIEHT